MRNTLCFAGKTGLYLFLGVVLMGIAPHLSFAQTVYDTTSSLTWPGNSTPYSLNFNTGVIPNDATVTLEIRVLSSVSPDNRDFLMCGPGTLYPFTTGSFTGLPKTLSYNISGCVRGYDLSAGNRLCTTNAWNMGTCTGLFYGTAGNNSVLEYARVTVTLSGAPTATTQAVSNIAATTATGNGNVTVLGSSNPTQHGHVWATTQNPTISNSKTQLGGKSSTGAFTSSITGLSPGTTYYVRAYATNGVTTAYGTQVSFTTLDTYTLSYEAGSGGVLSGDTEQTVNGGEDATAVTAVPNEGYYFVKWSDESTENPRTDTDVSDTVDVSATFAITPTLSNVEIINRTNSGATFSWDSNVGATSKVYYGLSNARGFSTDEVEDLTLSHTAELSGLVACARQYYRIVSEDEHGTPASYTEGSFMTTGCARSYLSGEGEDSLVDRLEGGEVELENNASIATLTIPTGYHTVSSTFQINKLEPVDLSMPGGIGLIDENVFSLVALDENGDEVTTFDEDLTFTIAYGAGTAAAFSEDTLDVYRYNEDTGVWDAQACDLSVDTRTITCALSSFSTYGLFGQLSESSGQGSVSRSGSTRSGGSVVSRVQNLLATGNTQTAAALMSDWPQLFAEPALPNSAPVRDLEYGMSGEDVRKLQVLLNTNGYLVAETGAGSPGNETTYFGTRTRLALSSYQTANNIAPAVGYFGHVTQSHMTEWRVAGSWW